MNVKIIVNYEWVLVGVVLEWLQKNGYTVHVNKVAHIILTIEDKIKMKITITITVTVSVNLF